MKVTDLKENECIHCETEEQANAICRLMHDVGLKWRFGGSYLVDKKNYHNICFYPKSGEHGSLKYAIERNHTIYKAEQFLTQETKTMQTKITLANQSQELNIIPLEGFEIDLENSDLKNGKVLFKEVEKKYPNTFFYCEKTSGKLINTHLSPKYANKLSILDTLLCLRDEYNRIDGFEEGFMFSRDNWCISNYCNKLNISCWSLPNGIMHFGKEETAELFLKNFEEQLEQIKEFL